ncbi:hypothetical protein NQ094_09080 [Enterobacter kobei]|uniref:hypothetical protein n=1 Tax=Enterobacter kobei TaxID=208224 RepID=UPI00214A1A58|nr:hypothetical protein [Enterobacter kobei]MCR2796173.1 hypothetical protein [Enterobacter kobei]
MLSRYTDGARALIYTIAAAAVLAFAAISILIVSPIDPTPHRITTFYAPEFLPTKMDADFGCQSERALQVIIVDDVAKWLITTNRNAVCMKKKANGFWVIYAAKELKKK